MIKKVTVILAALTLAGCAADRQGRDWAQDCMRNSSENANALSECEANKAADALKNKDCAKPCDTMRKGVTLTADPGIAMTDPGKEGKNTDNNPAHVE